MRIFKKWQTGIRWNFPQNSIVSRGKSTVFFPAWELQFLLIKPLSTLILREVPMAVSRSAHSSYSPAAAAPAQKPVISPIKMQEEIQKRAKEIYLARDASAGSALSDWLQAEKEVKAKYSLSTRIY
jgi:hypothetical protein